jgi:hypothetical protein
MERSFYLPRYDDGRMHNAPSHINKLSHSRQMVLALLLVAFAWLQLAGMAHKYAHASTSTAVQASQSLEGLFVEHSPQNKSDCQLLDLQSGGLALSKALPVLALPVFSVQAAWLQVAPDFTFAQQHYNARAPPKPSI